MNKDHIYAFYGSLRRGMNNYERYQHALVYLYSARVAGFKLYSRGQYPCIALATKQDSVVVEVFRIIDPVVEAEIHDMEMEEGYIFKNVEINGTPTGIYLFENIENFQEVQSGDWMDFFRDL